MNNLKSVGIFFIVDSSILSDRVSLENAEPYGDALTHGGHYEYHDTFKATLPLEYRFKKHDYDYYARGRVVYFPQNGTFIVYVDKCISEDDVSRIIDLFGLEASSMTIVVDEHYKCAKCNKFYFE